MLLNHGNITAEIDEEDAYNGDMHSMSLVGVTHRPLINENFRFDVTGPAVVRPMRPAGTVVVKKGSKPYWELNSLPGIAEVQTMEERRQIAIRNGVSAKELRTVGL